jgi:hypothetical protein
MNSGYAGDFRHPSASRLVDRLINTRRCLILKSGVAQKLITLPISNGQEMPSQNRRWTLVHDCTSE